MEGTTTRFSDPCLVPISPLVERDLVWGGYIDPNTSNSPLTKARIEKIECEMNEFNCEWMNPSQMGSLKYWAQASLRYPLMA